MMLWFKKLIVKPQSRYVPLPFVYLHESALAQTERSLRQKVGGNSFHEQIVYWAGKQGVDYSVVTTAIAPRATTTAGSFETSAQDNAAMIEVLSGAKIELIGQVHSHPGELVDHSEGDNEGALMPFEGFLSIVVPWYGRVGMSPLTQCGVHRFEGGLFRRLTAREINQMFLLTPAFKKV